MPGLEITLWTMHDLDWSDGGTDKPKTAIEKKRERDEAKAAQLEKVRQERKAKKEGKPLVSAPPRIEDDNGIAERGEEDPKDFLVVLTAQPQKVQLTIPGVQGAEPQPPKRRRRAQGRKRKTS